MPLLGSKKENGLLKSSFY